MDIIQQIRQSRTSAKAEPRKRHLRDLIQIAILYKREGLLSDVDPSNPNYLSRAAEELSVAASISVKGAKAILKIVGIRKNESSWTVLRDAHTLAIFEAEKFTGHIGGDENFQCFCLSFLERFIDCEEASLSVNTSQNLDFIVACFTPGARDRCVAMFLKCVSVIGTLCSFFPKETEAEKCKSTDIIERYLSQSWMSVSQQKQYHSSTNHQHALSGWPIVTEVFKVQVQELLFSKQGTYARRGQRVEDYSRNILISEDDLKNTVHVFCYHAIVELFAWVFHLRRTNETMSSFLGSTCDLIDIMNNKLSQEIECEVKEMIPGSLIISALNHIKAEAPTMAEIRYDEAEMVPVLREDRQRLHLLWDAKEMILRCRWNDSPVTTVYRTFLKSSQNMGLIALRDRQQNVPSLRDIPSQLPNSPPLSSRDLSLKRSRPIIDNLRGYRPSQRRLRDDNLHEHGRFTGHFDQVSMPSHRFDERQHFGPHHGRVRRPSQPSRHTRHCEGPHRSVTHRDDVFTGPPGPPPDFGGPQHFAPLRNDVSIRPPGSPPFDGPQNFVPHRENVPLRPPSHIFLCDDPHHFGPHPIRSPRLPRMDCLPPFDNTRQFIPLEQRWLSMIRPLIRRESVEESPKRHGPGHCAKQSQNPEIKRLPNYLKDGDEYENEGFDDEDDQNDTGRNEYDERMNETIQNLYDTVLEWPIFQVMREREFLSSGRRKPLNIKDKLSTNLLTGIRPWLRAYLEREHAIMTDVTTAKNITEYSSHWKALLPLEIRAVIQESVGTILPQCKEGSKKRFQDELEADSFITCVVKQSSPSRGVMNLTCVSTQPMINKRIVEELQGGTVCVGYISSKESSTNLILFGCRRVHWDAKDIIHMGADRHIEKIKLHLVVSRERVKKLGVWPEHLIRLRHLTHFAPYLRMYKAIEESSHLPPVVKSTLFGDISSTQAANSETEKKFVNPGCAQYLEGLRNTSAKVNEPQIDALRSVLANIGECALGNIMEYHWRTFHILE